MQDRIRQIDETSCTGLYIDVKAGKDRSEQLLCALRLTLTCSRSFFFIRSAPNRDITLDADQSMFYAISRSEIVDLK
jgi:hypothetical protein